MSGTVRINRYLAAAGLGTRREVEGLLRAGRVTVNGAACTAPSTQVATGDVVLLDGLPLGAGPTGAVLCRAPGAAITLVHPGELHAVLGRSGQGSGLELLLADAALAARLSDPTFPLKERIDRAGRRTRLGDLELGDLPPGDWRPLAPRELERLRRGARLPPRAG
ncbi:MAG: S4 domain-containing protein [Gaiellales bacterium]